MRPSLRRMTASDLAAGLRLSRLNSWNQMEEDWRCFLDSPSGGGWLAELDGGVVGTVAWRQYGRAFTWLSMMLVDERVRRMGIGTQLFEAALDSLRSEACVRLDATPAGEPLYRRYGFVPEYILVRTQITVAADRLPPSSRAARPMTQEDFPSVFARDHTVFGADRSELLASFYSRAPELAWIAADASAYCFGRPGYRCAQLGPIVASSPSTACDLVSQCLASQEGRSLIVDAPRHIPEWTAWMESVGFVMERPFLRMRRGENANSGDPNLQFGIAGPEFG